MSATPTVFVLLGGLAYWGHHTGWTLPKYSSLFSDTIQENPWCEEHCVPQADCIECLHDVAEIADGKYEFCTLHGVPVCLWEHPEAAELTATPTITPEERAAAYDALRLTPRAENNQLCELHRRLVQFASAEAAERAGVEVATVTLGPVVESVTGNGEIVYDRTRLAKMSSRVPGTMARVFKQVGDRVERGELIALIDSADVGRIKSEYLQALAHDRLTHTNLERLRPLAVNKEVPERLFREAETADDEAHIKVLGARQALVNLGFVFETSAIEHLPIEQINTVLERLGLPEGVGADLGPTSNLFPIRAPLDGFVTERDVVDGEAIATTSTLFTLADVRRMWLFVDVRQDDVERIAPGLPVRFIPSGASANVVSGHIAWISTEADARTRTVRVRVELPNDNSRLRANTFGTAEIVLRETPQAIVLPTEAVHWEGCCHVVFVRDRNWYRPESPRFFHVRKLRLGVRNGSQTEILAGLLPGEVIAVKGSSALLAQLLRSKISVDDEGN